MDFDIEYYNQKLKQQKNLTANGMDWKYMADFILNENTQVFRKSCQNINQGLYLDLKDLTNWIK
jgi:hypothetical protein